MMDMNIFFFASDRAKNFLFKGLDINGTEAVIAACSILGLLTFLLEGTKTLMVYWIIRINQHPLTYGQTDGHPQDYQDQSPLFASLMIPANLEQIKLRRIKYHILGTLTHIFNLTLGYLIMLAVMTYNIWMLVAVLLGSAFGHFLFGAYTQFLQQKFSNLMIRSSEDAGQINSVRQDASLESI